MGGLSGFLIAGWAVVASACTVPVFRYALDRWEADPYRLVIPADWAMDRDKVKLLVPLRGNGIANVFVEESADPSLDRARLLFPKDDEVLWEGALEAPSLEALLDSPARRELLSRILAGESVVWVVVTKEEDRAEVERVASRLEFLEQVAVLPEQDPNDPESRLGPGPPLRLKFSVLPLSLDDPAERLFAAMLAGPEHGELVAAGVPFAAPVFGRGRVLGAWPLADFDEAEIEDASLFLIGRCSCRVKNENPGWDLLLQADWEASLAGANATKAVTDTDSTPPAEALSETVVIAPGALAAPVEPSGLSWGTLGGIGLALIFALAGWRLWRAR